MSNYGGIRRIRCMETVSQLVGPIGLESSLKLRTIGRGNPNTAESIQELESVIVQTKGSEGDQI
jgi:hypothetical protein